MAKHGWTATIFIYICLFWFTSCINLKYVNHLFSYPPAFAASSFISNNDAFRDLKPHRHVGNSCSRVDGLPEQVIFLLHFWLTYTHPLPRYIRKQRYAPGTTDVDAKSEFQVDIKCSQKGDDARKMSKDNTVSQIIITNGCHDDGGGETERAHTYYAS